MDFKELYKSIKAGILDLVKERFNEESSLIKNDVDLFLEQSKDKLERWGLLLNQGAITPTEFELLLQSQKDLLIIQTLEKAGVSKIKIGLFKNAAIKLIVSKAVTLIL